jgi:hypothetical protein
MGRVNLDVRNAVLFRSEVVARNVSNFKRGLRSYFNELTVRKFDFLNMQSYSAIFLNVVRSGISNI